MKFKLFAVSLFAFAPAVWAQSIAGLWDATVTSNGATIPFKIEFSGEGSNVKGWFFNGDEPKSRTRANWITAS
jgi:hypothetical protein